MEYQIVIRAYVEELQGVVNRFLKDGWEPLGPPFTWGDIICQAMIKKGLSNETT